MDYFLSIIIPVYKTEEKYLRKCLDSLLEQSFKCFRVFTVDDGSPDKCGDICDEYAEKDSRFKVIHQQNFGVSVARNEALARVETEWVTFVDPDDWVENDYAEKIYKATQTKNAEIILFDYFKEYTDKCIKVHLMEHDRYLDTDWIKRFRLALFNFLVVDGKRFDYEINTIWNKVYKTDLLHNNALHFDRRARKGQDVIFNAECLQCSNKIYYIHEALYHYSCLQDSITNRFNPDVRFYNEVAFEHYERVINKYNLPDEYWEAYYAKVVTRLYSCMRLFYFHPKNKQSKSDVNAEITKILNKYPYNTAMERVKYKELTLDQRIFVFFLKKKNYGVLRLLVSGRQKIKEIKGLKLKRG